MAGTKGVIEKACRRYATYTQPYRLPKGRLDRGHIFYTSHTAVPTAWLYGWLPLSDAYGIGLAGSWLKKQLELQVPPKKQVKERMRKLAEKHPDNKEQSYPKMTATEARDFIVE